MVVLGITTLRIETLAAGQRGASPPTSRALAAFLLAVQQPQTGLLESFPSSREPALGHIGFTYDQAVCAIVLSHRRLLAQADRLLQPFREMALPSPDSHAFNTAYHTQTARPALEYRLHGGPLFWIAIAFMRYGERSGRADDIDRGVRLVEWAARRLPHFRGGVAMGMVEPWDTLMSVENNWVYLGALRLATVHLPQGVRRQTLFDEEQHVRDWLERNLHNRGEGDPTKALDVYTHALLVGPEPHLRDGSPADRQRVAEWARGWIDELDELFQVPGTHRYDYTDAHEARLIARPRAGWLEGSEQVALARLTWAAVFEERGDSGMASQLREQAASIHAEVLEFALGQRRGIGVPTSDAVEPFRTFSDGWITRPRFEPALNATAWAYFVEVGYNPFTDRLSRWPDHNSMEPD